jgi:hypothetical protein
MIITDLEPIETLPSAPRRAARQSKIKFSEAWCAHLTPQATRLPFWDDACPGLALLLHPTGNRVFYAVARRSWSPIPVWQHLGCWPELTVKGARLAARTAVEKITHEAPPKPKGAMIVDLIELYIESTCWPSIPRPASQNSARAKSTPVSFAASPSRHGRG